MAAISTGQTRSGVFEVLLGQKFAHGVFIVQSRPGGIADFAVHIQPTAALKFTHCAFSVFAKVVVNFQHRCGAMLVEQALQNGHGFGLAAAF